MAVPAPVQAASVDVAAPVRAAVRAVEGRILPCLDRPPGLSELFSCLEGSLCMYIDSGRGMLCCPEGLCHTMDPISCDLRLQNPATVGSTLKSIRFNVTGDALSGCGGPTCCPFGFYCSNTPSGTPVCIVEGLNTLEEGNAKASYATVAKPSSTTTSPTPTLGTGSGGGNNNGGGGGSGGGGGGGSKGNTAIVLTSVNRATPVPIADVSTSSTISTGSTSTSSTSRSSSSTSSDDSGNGNRGGRGDGSNDTNGSSTSIVGTVAPLPTISGGSGSSPNQPSITTIALSAILGLFLIIAIVAIWLFRHRRRQQAVNPRFGRARGRREAGTMRHLRNKLLPWNQQEQYEKPELEAQFSEIKELDASPPKPFELASDDSDLTPLSEKPPPSSPSTKAEPFELPATPLPAAPTPPKRSSSRASSWSRGWPVIWPIQARSESYVGEEEGRQGREARNTR